MYRIRMLQHHGVVPYVVFDGDHLPSKASTERDRESRRAASRAKAEELSAQGNEAAAFEHYAKCVEITPEMAFQLIKALKAQGVDYVVAPYEADAQLAYLERSGIIDATVTEDSDLLVFGCKRVLFKMDSDGHCIEIEQARLTACKTLCFTGWTSDLFRQMAIMSGCDYLPSIQGMGLKNAHKLLQRYKSVKRALQAVRLEGKMRVPPNYQVEFEQAEKTFLHQTVWDPRTKSLTHLQPLEKEDVDNVVVAHYVGPVIEQHIALRIARGEVDPISRQPIADTMPSVVPRPSALADRGQGSTSKTKLKGQQGLERFLTTPKQGGPASETKRQPLAPRNLNKAASTASAEDMASVCKSVFFGGSSKGITKAVSVSVIDVTSDEALQLNRSDSAHPLSDIEEQSPIRGIGDFFCELDGADERLLVADEAVMIRAEPLSGPDSSSELFAVERGVAARFEDPEGPVKPTYQWGQTKDSLCSDMSEGETTPGKGSHALDSTFSSPLTFDDEDEEEDEAPSLSAKHGKRPPASRTHPVSRKFGRGLRDVISSPISSANPSVDVIVSEQPRIDSPVSPLRLKSQSRQTKRKREEDRVETDGEFSVEHIGPSIEGLLTGLWDQFAHKEERGSSVSKGQAPEDRAMTPARRPALRTRATAADEQTCGCPIAPAPVASFSSKRPLRLYRSQKEEEITPFRVTARTGSAHDQQPPHADSATERINVLPRSNSINAGLAGSALTFASEPRPGYGSAWRPGATMRKPSVVSRTDADFAEAAATSSSSITAVTPLSKRSKTFPSTYNGSIKRKAATLPMLLASEHRAWSSAAAAGSPSSKALLDSFRFRRSRP